MGPSRWQRACSVVAVSRAGKVFTRVLDGSRDTSTRFDDLRSVMLAMGFTERTHGSHHIFGRSGIPEIINLQRDGRDAKVYQVRQVRAAILKYNLSVGG